MKTLLLLVCACFLFGCIEQSDLVCLSICQKKFPGYKFKMRVVKRFYLMDSEATTCMCPLILPLGAKFPGNREAVEQNSETYGDSK